MKFRSNSELRYRIRAKSQLIIVQSELIYELRDQIRVALDSPSDSDRYKKIIEMLEVLSNVTRKNIYLIDEMQNDIAKMREEKISQ